MHYILQVSKRGIETASIEAAAKFLRTMMGAGEVETYSSSHAVLSVQPTCYPGLGVFQDLKGNITAVQNDPLFDWVQAREGRSARTEQIARRLDATPLEDTSFDPFHPAAIIRLRGERDSVGPIALLRNDLAGAAPIYVASHAAGFIVSSSPDLIAALIRPSLDRLSCLQFALQGWVSFPHTMFEGIHEVCPNSVVTVFNRNENIELKITTLAADNANVPASVSSLEEFRSRFDSFIEEFFERFKRNLIADGDSPEILSTLSAGMDTRVVTAMAKSHLGDSLATITYSAEENREVRIARQVAGHFGLRHFNKYWNFETYKARFLQGHGLAAGSHRRWEDAHFLRAQKPAPGTVALGGYLSDALLDKGTGGYLQRLGAVGSGRLRPDAPIGVMAKQWDAVDNEVKDALTQRFEEAFMKASPFIGPCHDLAYAFPVNRAIAAAHWIGITRIWAHYEPFLCAPFYRLSIAGAPLRRDGFKKDVLAKYIEQFRLDEMPINGHDEGDKFNGAWINLSTVLEDDQQFASAYKRLHKNGLKLALGRYAARPYYRTSVNLYWAASLSRSAGYKWLKLAWGTIVARLNRR